VKSLPSYVIAYHMLLFCVFTFTNLLLDKAEGDDFLIDVYFPQDFTLFMFMFMFMFMLIFSKSHGNFFVLV